MYFQTANQLTFRKLNVAAAAAKVLNLKMLKVNAAKHPSQVVCFEDEIEENGLSANIKIKGVFLRKDRKKQDRVC